MAAIYYNLRYHPPPLTPSPTLSNSKILCKKKKNTAAFEEKKSVFVDYDAGQHDVSTHVTGLRKADLQKRYRLKVEGDRFQKDWSLSQVVEKILELDPEYGAVEGLLNHWVGRFARKNFPRLIKEITQRGSLEHSNRVFSWMKDQKNYCARNDIYNMMIRLHARHNRTDQARGLFFEMQEWRCKPDAETYNALINAHGRAGQWRWAMNIMEDMLREAIPPSRSTYNNLISACGSTGNWREALKICKKMTENGVGPDLVTHNIVLSAYKTGGQHLKALSYYELMKGTNVRPDTTTLNIVIYCFLKLRQYEKAIDIFNSMREQRAECHPDVVTYTSIIHLYSVSGQIENCKAVFNVMLAEGLKPNVVSYNALLGAYASHGMSEEALSIFNEIKASGFRPDVVSYTSLLSSYGRSKQPKKAREVFNMMKRDKLKPSVVSYNALIDAYGSNGFLAEAVQVLREMEENGIHPNTVSICTLLAACGRCGQKVNVDAVLSAAKMRGIELNTVAYNSAIGSYMNVGEYEKAVALYKSMRKKRVTTDSVTYTVLISGSCKMSKYDEALEFYADMMNMKIPLTREAYSSIICAYSKQGQIKEAESIFNMMKTAGCCPDVITYTTMLHAYNAAGYFLNPQYQYGPHDIGNDDEIMLGLKKVIQRLESDLVNQGKALNQALLFRDKMESFGTALAQKAITFTSPEYWEKAFSVFQEMEEYGIQPDTIACSALMRAFNKGGKPTQVLILADLMKEKEIPFTDAIFFEMVSACSLLQDWRRTIDLAKLMEPSFSVVSIGLLNQLLHLLGKSGKIEFMMKLFYKITEAGAEINLNTHSILLKNLLSVGNWRKYIEVLEWMMDAGIQPSNGMYHDIFSYVQKSGGAEYAAVVQERVESLRRRCEKQNLSRKV